MLQFLRRHASVASTGVVVLGVMWGVLVGSFAANYVHDRAGRAELYRYAERLLVRGEQMGRETDTAVSQVANDHLPFCSLKELAFMRTIVYNSVDIRDIGRTRDDKFYCATGVGVLAEPQPNQTPTVVAGQIRLYPSVHLMFSDDSQGFVIEMQGVSVALNARTYLSLDEPPMMFGGWVYFRKQDILLHGFGHDMPVSHAEILRGWLVEHDGVMYQPLCARTAAVCVVASERRRDLMARNAPVARYAIVIGAVLGGAFALIGVLYLRTRRSLESQLRRAILSQSVSLEYQPIVDLKTRSIVGAETLARWTSETGEVVRPELFIALAEEKRFVTDITRLVIKIMVSELGSLLVDNRLNDFRVTVNIAAQDLHNPTFLGYVEKCFQSARLSATSVGFELTERSTADQSKAIEAIAELKRLGHVVYIDDFGTGYSSLAYLHRLSVHAIKIDRSLTATIGTEAVTASVIPQILEMATKLNLLVVVEGIETQAQVDYFEAATARVLGQGYFFGKPMPAAHLRDILAKGRSWNASDTK